MQAIPALYTWVQSLGEEDSLEKEMATHSSILAWKIPWTEEPGRLQSMWSQRVGHDWAHMHTWYFYEISLYDGFLLLLLDFGECVLTFYLGQIQIEVSFNTNLTGLSPWYTCMFSFLSSHSYHVILSIESIISLPCPVDINTTHSTKMSAFMITLPFMQIMLLFLFFLAYCGKIF